MVQYGYSSRIMNKLKYVGPPRGSGGAWCFYMCFCKCLFRRRILDKTFVPCSKYKGPLIIRGAKDFANINEGGLSAKCGDKY